LRFNYNIENKYAYIMHMDSIDKQLLSLLQNNAHMTAQDISCRLNLSASQVNRRRQKLELDGYIYAYRAQVNAERLGLNVQAFVQVQLDRHGPENSQEFNRILSTSPEIISAWTLTGEADYLLRVYCLDLRDLNRLIHEVLLKSPLCVTGAKPNCDGSVQGGFCPANLKGEIWKVFYHKR
jgi:DNA-binding Lrp family transcriptional regulator